MELPSTPLEAGPARHPAPRKDTVLILEDEGNIRELLTIALSKAGIRSRNTDNGQDALRWIRRDRDVAVVLTNLEMPVMRGEEFLKRLQRTPAAHRPYAYVMTGSFLTDAQRQALADLDVLEILEKPFNLRRLLALMKEAIDAAPFTQA